MDLIKEIGEILRNEQIKILSLPFTKQTFSLDWALKIAIIFTHLTQLGGNLSDNSLSFYWGCHGIHVKSSEHNFEEFFLGILYRLKW